MTRMTSDIEALTQLLQTGLVNALVACSRASASASPWSSWTGSWRWS